MPPGAWPTCQCQGDGGDPQPLTLLLVCFLPHQTPRFPQLGLPDPRGAPPTSTCQPRAGLSRKGLGSSPQPLWSARRTGLGCWAVLGKSLLLLSSFSILPFLSFQLPTHIHRE